MFEASSFCSTSSISSGETTFSGSSRFKSSYDRNFLSPPSCSSRSITSSLSFSSIATVCKFLFPFVCGAQQQLTRRTIGCLRPRQQRAASLFQVQLLHGETVEFLAISGAFSFSQLGTQFVDIAIEFRHTQRAQTTISCSQRLVERLSRIRHHQARQQLAGLRVVRCG